MTFVAFDELQKHFNNSLANVSSRMFAKAQGDLQADTAKQKGLTILWVWEMFSIIFNNYSNWFVIQKLNNTEMFLFD